MSDIGLAGTFFPISKARLWLNAAVALYIWVLWYSYANFITPAFWSFGMEYHPNPVKSVQAVIMIFVSAQLLPLVPVKVSDYVVTLFFVLPYSCHLLLYSFLDGDPVYFYTSVLAFFILALVRNLPLAMPKPTLSWSGVMVAAIVCSIGVVVAAALFVFAVGMDNFNLNPLAVYDFRSAVNDAGSDNALLGYVGFWGYKIFVPFLIALLLWKKQWLWIVPLYGVQVFFFGISSAKSALAIPFLVFAAYVLGRKQLSSIYIVLAGMGIVALGVFEETTYKTGLLNLLLIRREFWDPASLNWIYHDIFDQFGFVYWGDTFLSSMRNYQLPNAPQTFVDLYYYGWNGNAGTGFLGSGYMEAGLYGVIGYALVLALILAVIDNISENALPTWLGLAMVIVPCYFALSSADLMAALATHGLLVAIALLYISSLRKTAP